MGAQNKDFGAVSQLDLSRSLVPSVEQTSSPQLIIESVIDFTGNLPMKSMAVSIKYGLRTADHGLRTGYKIRTRYKTRTPD